MSRQEIELLRHVYDDWSQGDFHSGRDLLDEHVEFRMGGPYGDATRGRDVFEQQLREFLGTWTDYSIEAEEFVDAGDKVLIQAANEIKLSCGQSSMVLKKNGTIEIKGMKIDIQGSQSVKQEAAQITSDASAVNTIKGGLVKIN